MRKRKGWSGRKISGAVKTIRTTTSPVDSRDNYKSTTRTWRRKLTYPQHVYVCTHLQEERGEKRITNKETKRVNSETTLHLSSPFFSSSFSPRHSRGDLTFQRWSYIWPIKPNETRVEKRGDDERRRSTQHAESIDSGVTWRFPFVALYAATAYSLTRELTMRVLDCLRCRGTILTRPDNEGPRVRIAFCKAYRIYYAPRGAIIISNVASKKSCLLQ